MGLINRRNLRRAQRLLEKNRHRVGDLAEKAGEKLDEVTGGKSENITAKATEAAKKYSAGATTHSGRSAAGDPADFHQGAPVRSDVPPASAASPPTAGSSSSSASAAATAFTAAANAAANLMNSAAQARAAHTGQAPRPADDGAEPSAKVEATGAPGQTGTDGTGPVETDDGGPGGQHASP